MPPSSLVFVLVVALWAVYLLQHWVARRDHLATLRSVDRFSAAMRVLDHHRHSTPRAPEVEPRAYAGSPMRAARPAVVVRRATPAGDTPVLSGSTAAPRATRPGGGSAALVQRVADVPRRTRGRVLLTHLVLLPLVLLLAAFGPLPWWAPVLLLASTAATLAWVRQGVLADQQAARAGRRRRPVAAPGPRPTGRPAEPARPRVPAETSADRDPAPAPAARRTVLFDGAGTTPGPRPVLADRLAPMPEATPEADAPAPAQPVAPGSWSPVPVPRPTYTMKARAPRALDLGSAELGALDAVDADLVDPHLARAAHG